MASSIWVCRGGKIGQTSLLRCWIIPVCHITCGTRAKSEGESFEFAECRSIYSTRTRLSHEAFCIDVEVSSAHNIPQALLCELRSLKRQRSCKIPLTMRADDARELAHSVQPRGMPILKSPPSLLFFVLWGWLVFDIMVCERSFSILHPHFAYIRYTALCTKLLCTKAVCKLSCSARVPWALWMLSLKWQFISFAIKGLTIISRTSFSSSSEVFSRMYSHLRCFVCLAA